MCAAVTELDFEAAIEAWLIDHGDYEKADNSQFDAALALDTETLLAFIKQTQPDTWDKLSASYGGNVEKSVLIVLPLNVIVAVFWMWCATVCGIAGRRLTLLISNRLPA